MENLARHIRDGSPSCILLLQRVTGAGYADLHNAVEDMTRWERGRLDALAREILDDAHDIALSDAHRYVV
jgi:hypothetical protein